MKGHWPRWLDGEARHAQKTLVLNFRPYLWFLLYDARRTLDTGGFDIALAQCQHAGVTVVLDKELEMLIGRLVASGRFHSPHEAVRAGLQKLEGEAGIPSAFESFPEGSLAKFFTPENNSEERELFKACSMAVEDE